MSYTLTPNMLLPVPGVGTEAGPQYAQDVNTSLTILDAHDHTNGSGVKITPQAMNINSALTFADNPATEVSYLTFTPQLSTPSVGTLYESGVDLYYVDGNGNNIQITASGGIAGTPGSIANLTPPASVTYVSGSQTFVFQSNTSVAANLDAGSVLLRNLTPNSTYAMTLSPPSNLAANYTVTMPAPPVSDSYVVMNSSGAITASVPTNSAFVATANIIDANVTPAKLSFTPELTRVLITASGSFVVPPNVTNLVVVASGGGGGGGGGGSFLGGDGGGGGGGGTGAPVICIVTPVTAGETITNVIGAGGAGGAAGSFGLAGGDTTISGTFGTCTFPGGLAGLGGTGTTGAAARTSQVVVNAIATGGGAGGNSNTAGGAGSASSRATAGAGGAPGGGDNSSGGGGGGGGGSASLGAAGGAGGVFPITNGSPGSSASANSGGGGGGGGGAQSSGNAGAGGNGGSGRIEFFYIPT